MSLPPEIRELLDSDARLGRRLEGRSYREQQTIIRDALEGRARETGLVVAQVGSVEDFRVPAGGREIRTRVYTPLGPPPHPAFLHFHGGGFVGGSIDWTYNSAKCAHICASAGCVVATVDYRLAPDHPYPAAPEDCYTALLWLVDRATELGIDATRIVVGGESAGGNLAAVTALMTRDRNGPPLMLQLLEVPVTDMSDRSADFPSLDVFGRGYGLDRTTIEDFQNAYLPDRDRRRDAYASPLRAADLREVAPAYILTAEFDPLRDSGEEYARRLQEAGVRTTLHRFRGHTHGSSALWQTWAPARAWMEEVVVAIRDAACQATNASVEVRQG
jgi:acetyl esterase